MNKLLTLFSVFLVVALITACDNDNDTQEIIQVLTEKDFINNPDLMASPERGIIATSLEPPTAAEHENQTGETGFDVFTYNYERLLNHKFCFINAAEDSKHSVTLQNLNEEEVFSAQAGSDCIDVMVEPGSYDLIVTHGEHIDTMDNIFLITVPDSEELTKENRNSTFSFTNLFEKIGNLLTKNTIAQTPDDNVITLISTNSCVGCDLSGADLTGNDFTAANLTAANISGSSLSGVSFSSAILFNANLSGADLSDTNGITDLSGAQMTGANLSGADLTGADFSGAELTRAIFIDADVTDAVFDQADLVFAIWTNGGICSAGSIGFCLNTLLDGPKVCESIRQDFTDDGTKVYKCLLPTVNKDECTLVVDPSEDDHWRCDPIDTEDLVISVDLEDIIDQANTKFSANLNNNTPLAIMAWGGEGSWGEGGFFSDGGHGGDGGFASMVTTASDYLNNYDQTSFFFYLAQGGHHTNGGGASTLVMLVESNPSSLEDVILIAGGGGGGEDASGFHNGANGAFGGVAASSEKGLRVIGQGRHSDGGAVQGGENGIGGNGEGNGRDGIGGRGGASFFEPSKWINGDPDVGSNGRGGNMEEDLIGDLEGAAGGGGHGGGGAGNDSSGAGGGSWLDKSTITCNSAPKIDDNDLTNFEVPPSPATSGFISPGEDDLEGGYGTETKNGAVEVWLFPEGCS